MAHNNPKRKPNNKTKQVDIRSGLRAIQLVTVFLIVLIGVSCATEQAVSQYTLPSRKETFQYVTGLIGRYNELVSFYYGTRSDFNSIKKLFPLYHDPDNYFQVIVMQSVPENANFLALTFIPTAESQLDLVMDNSDTLSGLLPHIISVTEEYTIVQNNNFTLSNGMTVYNGFIFVTLSTDVSVNSTLNGENAGQFIYNQTSENVPKTETSSSQTIIQSISQTQATSSATTDILSQFNDNPWVRLIDSVFGSIAEFVLIIVGIIVVVLHKKVISELKKLLQIESPYGDKPEKDKR